jgi:hypothetical protein
MTDRFTPTDARTVAIVMIVSAVVAVISLAYIVWRVM